MYDLDSVADDADAFRKAILQRKAYVPLYAKIKLIYDDLVAKGVSIEKLLRLHAPIGFEIGAVTVPEIAVSIASELIAVRRGREGTSARELRLDESELSAWLTRTKR